MSVSTLASTTTTSPDVEPTDECGVRFDTQCVLIPEPSPRHRMPRVVTKSYSLPLWKRRATIPDEKPERITGDENHVVLRLPLPSFSKKPQSPSRSADQGVLTPCLVHRSPSSGSTSPESPKVARRTLRKASLSPPRSDVVTVPLRPCCTACQAITEAAFADGDAWKERFSRAAHRRRSLSADGGARTIAVAGSVAAASLGALGHGVPINVDEVDKRRRSSDTGPTGKVSEMVWSSDGNDVQSHPNALHICRPDLPPSPSDAHPPSPNRIIPSTPRIPEEEDEDDEDQLFPLPSPRPRRKIRPTVLHHRIVLPGHPEQLQGKTSSSLLPPALLHHLSVFQKLQTL
ncbi:hypothetical protein F5I97DRAFT_1672343 [Phlebopus sp. FC_14]|nr:hypothetical protein F5I97DRAFT_1672343 [Phlebopus sp. FC_14]